MIGSTISHYKILEKLGEGGMGVVYKAQDTELDRTVALKFLPHYLTSDVTEKERFYHEARAASALNHPNITTIHEIKEHQNQLFLVMEFVEGKTLKKLIEQEPPSIKKVLDIAIQVCDGLATAHEKGIIHRDIKSDNIMLTPKGQVKIMDFGLAKVKGATKLTKAGSTLGTAAYMSPEQAQGEEVDHRSDIFSFGVVLYELLTTKLPFRGEHQAALMYSLINEEPHPIARFNEKITTELERFVSKALAKDRDDRYQHVDDLLADLRRERKNLEYAKTAHISTVQAPLAIPKKTGKKFLKYGIPATVAVLGLLLYVILNPFKVEVSTEKTVAAQKNSLAVMYFENIPDPDDKEHTGEMLTNLLITALSQARDLEVISRERLHDIQQELGLADAKRISSDRATEVAKKAGVEMMLMGSILQTQPKLAVTTRLIDVNSGRILQSQRLTGFGQDQIFAMVDSLALLVRSTLNIPTATAAETRSVAEVTTKSPEAYRSYVQGIDLLSKMLSADAKSPLERAIELDPDFAMAHFALARVAERVNDNETARKEIELAERLSARVTEREQLQILAFKYRLESNPRKSAETLEKLVDHYPHEQQAYVDLSISYSMLGEDEKAVQTCRRGLQRDPTMKLLWNMLAYRSAGLNRRQEALQAIDEYLKLAPGEPNPYDTKGDVYYAFRELDSARYWYQRAVAFRANFGSAQKLCYDALLRGDYAAAEKYRQEFGATADPVQKAFAEMDAAASMLVFRGQLPRAYQQLRSLLISHEAQNLQFNAFGDLVMLTVLAYELHDYPAMLDHANAASRIAHNDPDDPIYARDLVAWALAKNGNVRSAHQLLDEMRREITEEFPGLKSPVYYAAGLVAFEEGKYDEAARSFKNVRQLVWPMSDPDLHTAVSFLKIGDRDQAVEQLRRLTTTYFIGNVPLSLLFLPVPAYWPISTIKAHYWLGVAYEEQGKKDEAIKEYEKFLEIWRDADFESAELIDAKTRLKKLKGLALQ